MENPWVKVDLNIYEEHMASEQVLQLQTLRRITKQQVKDYINTSIAILGVAGGNGLEWIDTQCTKKVFGIDINPKYLDECKKRYTNLRDKLELICCDLNDVTTILPYSNILICNLIIEYLGVNKFIELISNNKDKVNIISCVIQKNNSNSFVSTSSLASAFDPIAAIHKDIEENQLILGFLNIGFTMVKKESYSLPNGKEFIRMDFLPN